VQAPILGRKLFLHRRLAKYHHCSQVHSCYCRKPRFHSHLFGNCFPKQFSVYGETINLYEVINDSNGDDHCDEQRGAVHNHRCSSNGLEKRLQKKSDGTWDDLINKVYFFAVISQWRVQKIRNCISNLSVTKNTWCRKGRLTINQQNNFS